VIERLGDGRQSPHWASDKIREVFTVVMLEGILKVSATEARDALKKLAAGRTEP